ncbi:Dihydrolipoyllysine-residue succinyltransferase component of 2-oxoglutarate dehydrogenase, partial [Globisporangium splendens]
MQSSTRTVLRQSARAAARATALRAFASRASVGASVLGARSLQNAAPLAVAALNNNTFAQVRSFSSAGAPVDVPVPSMGDSISEGTVVEWLKKPGDFVDVDEVVVVLETDKVSVDVRAPFAGTLAQHLAAIDDNVLVGAPLFQLVKGEGGAAAAAPVTAPTLEPVVSTPVAPTPAAPTPAGEPEIVNVPSMGDSISEGTIVHWAKSAGDAIAADEVVVVIETDKVSVDVRSPKGGVIQEVLAKVDEVVAIGAPLFKLLPGAAPAAAPAVAAPVAAEPVKVAPAAPASAPAATPKVAAPVAPAASTVNPLSFAPERNSRREKMSRMRLRTAERLKESQNTSASLTTFQEVDMTNIINLRKQYKDAFEAKHGAKLGFMSAFIKASASALLEVPGVNAMIDDAHQEIVYRDYVDMSVAVSTPKGLVTPVIQNTESMSFADIEKKLVELADRARAGKLTLEEMTGGNFTISNGGVFGSLMGTPIINLPQSAILGMHATKMRPVVYNGEVVARPMMYLALTYDHRLIDGREAVTCLKSIADKIENPERLLLDLPTATGAFPYAPSVVIPMFWTSFPCWQFWPKCTTSIPVSYPGFLQFLSGSRKYAQWSLNEASHKCEWSPAAYLRGGQENERQPQHLRRRSLCVCPSSPCCTRHMGVISVGAALGVKDDGASSAHPIITTPSVTTSPVVVGRRRGASSASLISVSASSAAASSAVPAPRAAHFYPQQQYQLNNNNDQQSANNRKKPLRKRAIAASGASSGAASTAATTTTTRPSISTNASSQQDDMGQWQVTRMVTVPTRFDPQMLLPHVIGNRGARMNGIMSQAKCIIMHQKRGLEAQRNSTNGFTMSFQVSADTIKRVDHGAKLIRSAIENAEQLMLQNQITVANGGSNSESSNTASAGERRQSSPHSSSKRSDLNKVTNAEESSVNDQTASSRGNKRTQPDSKDESDEEETGRDRKRRIASAESAKNSSKPDDDMDKNDEVLDIDAYRIQLQRSAALSRRIASEAAQAQAQMAIEKQKYVTLLRQAEAMKHKRRVSDLVVKAQCAILASPSTSAAKKKRVKIEQLSSVHDACWNNAAFRHVVAPDLRIQRPLRRKLSAPMAVPGPLGKQSTAKLLDDDLVQLFKKIEAFKKVVTQSVPTTEKQQQDAPEDEGNASYEFNDDVNNDDAPTTSPTGANAAENGLRSRSLSAVQLEARTPILASATSTTDPNSQESRRESFRSTWDVPGLTRDLNLVQDYMEESDCKLLHFLVGQRQYFYMEPLLLNHGMENPETLKRWILSEHDIERICRYLSENDQLGAKLVNSVREAEKEARANLTRSAGMFKSSKESQWAALQRQFVDLHSLALAVHLLGYHYHAIQALRSGEMRSNGRKSSPAPTTASPNRDLLADDTLTSDLFKFILRPIRSSAIESSLLDSLPISLVRETVEHCPEVLNHVLNWKEEEDIPTELPQDIQHAKSANGSSAYLQALMNRLSTHLSELSLVLTSLGGKARRKLDVQLKDITPDNQDKVIFLTNQFKTVMANVVMENIKLQLHKWGTVFLENSCSWVDSDFEDASMDYGSNGDRTYDKFTCLQDALFVWHNKKVLYSAKDDLAGIEETRSSNANVAASTTATSHKVKDTQFSTISASTSSSGQGSSSSTAPQHINRAVENELQLLKRLTPAAMLDKMENQFAVSDITKYLLSVKKTARLRGELFESLRTMKTLMEVMGRSAPWRTHVEHSNALKRELAKQADIEKRLVLNQWAFFYSRHKHIAVKTSGLDDLFGKQQSEDDTTTVANGKPAAPEEDEEKCAPADDIKESKTNKTAAMEIDWTGVFDLDNDSADAIEMKKLRHELQVTNSVLVKNVFGSSTGQGASGGDAQNGLDADHKALVEECNALTRSCVAALSKFLGDAVDSDVASQIHAACETTATTPRRRARTRSVVIPDEIPASVDHAPEVTSAPVDDSVGDSSSRKSRANADTGRKSARSPAQDDGSVASDVPATKKTAQRSSSFADDEGRERKNGAGSAASLTSTSSTSSSSLKKSRSSHNAAVPLRMGCSGCRDVRRRCTGCCGCSLHCVCVSCGCRVCCSTRLSAVQKTLAMLVSCVEANEGCKWVHPKPRASSLSSDAESSSATSSTPQFTSRICGMLRICFKCLYCGAHCTCVRPSASGHVGFGLRGGKTPSTRRERRFKAKPAATQRRTAAAVNEESVDPEIASTAPKTGPSVRTRQAATASAAAATASAAPSTSSASASEQPDIFSFPDDALPPSPRKDQGKNEQEDLFRAARVRMKLQRNAFSKLHSLYGSLPSNTFLDGEILWQPERIRMMWERKDFFGVLGVPRDATTQQIKRQYRKLALKLHPDKTMDVGSTQEQQNEGSGNSYTTSTADERVEAFVAVTHSYKLLSGDPKSSANNNLWKAAP